jgi:hypothetical protein
MKKEGFISEEEYSLARLVESMPARIYGLPKLQKRDCPLRPVMSTTKAVGYGLGKALTRRWEHLRRAPHFVKDTFDFVRRIQASVNANRRMLSFDVINLFTNVPLSFTITLILDRMYPACTIDCKDKPRKRQCQKCYRREDFRILLNAVTSDTQCMFDDQIFVQHNGVAMGAPLAPIIADIFMAELETILMDTRERKGLCEWHRYVDDTFVLEVLNCFHPSFKFTYEVKQDNSLPFLNVQVTRSPSLDSFTTTIYRKPTFTGLMTNWQSFVPFSHKKASVVSMIQRAISVYSTYALLAVELEGIRRICRLNGYPRGFVDVRIGIGSTKYLSKNGAKSNLPEAGYNKDRMYVEVPFIGDQTDLMEKKLQHLSATIRPGLEVRCYAKLPRTVKTFVPNKVPVPKNLELNTVYAFKWEECGDTYVSMTKRQIIKRLVEQGAPKGLLGRSNLNNVDTIEIINSAEHDPPLRRSSRIRNRMKTLATTVANNDDDRANSSDIKKRTKGRENPSFIAEHIHDTGHKIDWRNF